MKFLRLGICALISFAVAAHGGVEDWARAILEAGVALLFLVWALRFYFNEKEQAVFSPLLPPLALFFLVGLGQWFLRATASSYSTRIELLLLLASLIFLFLCLQGSWSCFSPWRLFLLYWARYVASAWPLSRCSRSCPSLRSSSQPRAAVL